MIDIQYDEHGGITNTEKTPEKKIVNHNNGKRRTGYNFFERLLSRHSRKVNYLLDKNGKYKCRLEKTPSVIRMGVTNRCSAQCFYCPREIVYANGSGYMAWEMYTEIIDWAKDNKVETIALALFGEPLLHPKIMDMIDLANRVGLAIRLSTNGIVLTKELAGKLLEYPLEAIEISMDGFTEEEYQKGKRVDKYLQAKDNVINLLAIAKGKKAETVFNIHFVDAGNVSLANKFKFIKFWKSRLAGLKYVTSFYYEPHNWAGTRDSKNKMSKFDRLLAKWEIKKPCVYIKGLNINWNGDVYICTNDPTVTAILGNCQDKSLEEIYNGARRMYYLTEHENGTFKEINCAICTVNNIYPLLFIKKRLMNKIASFFV